MKIGNEYKEIIEKKYAEAIRLNVSEIVLDQQILGGLKLYLSNVPKFSLGTFIMENGTEVSIGEESIETVSN